MENSIQQLNTETTQKLIESVMVFAEDHEEHVLLEKVVDAAIEITGARRGFLATLESRSEQQQINTGHKNLPFRTSYDQQQDIVVLVARNDQYQHIPEPRNEMSIGLLKKSIRSSAPQLASNIQQDDQLGNRQSVMNLNLASVISCPLIVQNQSIGAIYLDHPEEKGFFSDDELSALFFLASHAAVTIHNTHLHQQSIRDRLSGVFSNNYFQQRLNEEIKKSIRQNRPLSLLMTDLDDFKKINDIMGHAAGDRLIEEIGTLIEQELRGYDITARTEPVAGRYGGDEFEILLINTDADEAEAVAERLLNTINEHNFIIDEQKVDIKLSIGIATLPNDGKTANEITEAADEAMLKAKRKGGDRYHTFSADDQRDTRDKEEWGKQSIIEESYVSRDRMLVLSLLSEVTEAGLEVDKMLEVTLKMVVEVTNAKSGYVVTEKSGQLHTKAQFISGQDDIEDPVAQQATNMMSRQLIRKALRKDKGLLIENARENESFNKLATVDELDLRSVLVVPIRAGDRKIGVIYLENSAVASRFDEQDLSLVSELAREISSPLEAARTHQEKVNELESMKQRYETMQQDLQTQYSYKNIVGSSEAMQEVYDTLDKITSTNLNVLIEGETGTGKELAARSIHYNGPRKDHPFLAVNCARFSQTLLESELFGHQQGSFTGAVEDQPGLFEQADEGTLFLDEISEMSPDMQARLLRVLETGEVRRIGDDRTRSVDVRIICATNQPLDDLMEKGNFRRDLYYRLADAHIHMPPLRKRKEDIPELVNYFLEEVANDNDIPQKELDEDVMMTLVERDWPGNVRQLRSKVRQLAMFSGDKTTIQAEDLSITSKDSFRNQPKDSRSEEQKTLETDEQTSTSSSQPKEIQPLEELEKQEIQKAMKKSNGEKKQAAELLDIHYTTLYRKLKSYNLETMSQ